MDLLLRLIIDLILIMVAWRIFIAVSGCLIRLFLILFIIFIIAHLIYFI